eukprot:1626886-Pyramimonas_sp.AAC.1
MRGQQTRAHDAGTETPLMKKFRVTAASFIKAAQCVYSICVQDEEHEPNTYSAAWNDFVDAVVEQIVKAEPIFVRTPVVTEKSRWSRRTEACGSGTSKIRVPTPPAPPSGSAATEDLPIPPS